MSKGSEKAIDEEAFESSSSESSSDEDETFRGPTGWRGGQRRRGAKDVKTRSGVDFSSPKLPSPKKPVRRRRNQARAPLRVDEDGFAIPATKRGTRGGYEVPFACNSTEA
eukprot:GHVU01018440.1.p4 GENE.GHVU01018440.1~~GHVU01018440.1.p4  ORF type:complete len:110 (+),score=18.90 GHVU01018440.1:364-693(+)